MSQSPASEAEFSRAHDDDSEFRKNLKAINQSMSQGGSLSGHERNCAFLNLQGKPFATVSSVTGFDFADDARGLATVDWDADGDLDIWTSNRTSPRVRFLKNNLPSSNQHLSLLMKGVSCNRDAIGARVSVYPKAASKPIVKVVRAGEGYLSQSSKSLLFGLGTIQQSHVAKTEIKWPDSTTQVLRDLEVGRSYRIVQGAKPQLLAPRDAPSLAADRDAAQTALAESSHARIALTSAIPAARLPYQKFGSKLVLNAIGSGQPTFANLWASWCQPCIEELREFSARHDELQRAGVRIVAIAVDDELAESDSGSSPQQLAERLKLPFHVGTPTLELMQRLKTIYDLPFPIDVAMPVPVSFLIDAKDHVVAIYRGPTTVSQILKDVAQLQRGSSEWKRSALPLFGRWNKQPKETNRLAVPRDLLGRHQVDDTLSYVSQFEAELTTEKEVPTLRAWLGDELIAADRAREGLQQYELALKKSPDDLTLVNNYAWQLATQKDASLRNGSRAVQWAERAASATSHANAGVLDTLAAAYAEDGQFEKAVATASKGIQLSGGKRPEFSAKLRLRRELYRQRQAYHE